MTVRENSGIQVRLTAPRAHNTVGLVRRISVPRLCVALCVGAALSSAAVAADQDAWTIRILPATKLRLAQATPPSHPALPSQPAPPPYEPGTKSAPQANPSAPTATHAPPADGLRIIPGSAHAAGPMRRPSYTEVYRSVPFSRAEYVAHPSYRSEATLGLMLNQMPYPATGEPNVPQYGYVAPYQFDNTYGTPLSYSVYYGAPYGW
jgi:hypothetical protein